MRAVVLTAGLGTRLRPLTLRIPKPMIGVGGKPVLQHIIEKLHKFGVTEIVVNLHWLPEKIFTYFGHELIYSYEPKLLGEEGTLESLREWLEGQWFFVINGDTLSNIDLGDLYYSDSQDTRFMDSEHKEVYAGYRLCGPDYFDLPKNHKFKKFYNPNYWWVDMGTPEGLKRARKLYEKPHHLPKLPKAGGKTNLSRSPAGQYA